MIRHSRFAALENAIPERPILAIAFLPRVQALRSRLRSPSDIGIAAVWLTFIDETWTENEPVPSAMTLRQRLATDRKATARSSQSADPRRRRLMLRIGRGILASIRPRVWRGNGHRPLKHQARTGEVDYYRGTAARGVATFCREPAGRNPRANAPCRR